MKWQEDWSAGWRRRQVQAVEEHVRSAPASINQGLQVKHIVTSRMHASSRLGANPSVDAGMRVVDGNYKLSKNVKIAMLYLEDDDAVNAETYIKKASALISACKVMQHLLATRLHLSHVLEGACVQHVSHLETPGMVQCKCRHERGTCRRPVQANLPSAALKQHSCCHAEPALVRPQIACCDT